VSPHVLARRWGEACSVIELNQPDGRNVLDRATGAALLAAVIHAEDLPGNRILVLTATGPFFCGGLDLGDGVDQESMEESFPVLRDALMRLARSALTTVAVVDGVTTGGGVGLAAACDLVLAGPNARFRLTETLLGLVPAMIFPVLARRIGGHRTLALALTAEELDADAAVHSGLADHSVTDTKAALRGLLTKLRRADPAATRVLKEYYTSLYPPDWVAPETTMAVLRATAPGASARLTRFRNAGLLP
jgi:polyketide biosynthesis enoyl-CoA hydratase PksH